MEINAFDAKNLLSKKLETMPKFGKKETPFFLVDHREGECMRVYADEDGMIPSGIFTHDFLFQVEVGDDGSYEISLCF